MPSIHETDALLIEQFVASFAMLDEMSADKIRAGTLAFRRLRKRKSTSTVSKGK
jgi:hypothetical protein